MFEAILLSYSKDEENDPSRSGFESEDKAWEYVESHRCKMCVDEAKEDKEFICPCDAEWMVGPTDNKCVSSKRTNIRRTASKQIPDNG